MREELPGRFIRITVNNELLKVYPRFFARHVGSFHLRDHHTDETDRPLTGQGAAHWIDLIQSAPPAVLAVATPDVQFRDQLLSL